MSFQAMTWAVEQDLPALQKLVLLMLANRTNHDTGLCYPSLTRLMAECGMSKFSVIKAIKALEVGGLIEIRRSKINGVDQPNHYRLVMARAACDDEVGSTPGALGVVRHTYQGSAPHALGVVRHTHPNLEGNQEVNLKTTPPNPPQAGGLQDPEGKPRKPKKPPIEFKTFLTACKIAGEKAIGDYQPMLTYIAKVGLPEEYAQLYWAEYRRRHSPGGTEETRRQADWRKAFLKHLQGNYYRLWFYDTRTGQFTLTTTGHQAERVSA